MEDRNMTFAAKDNELARSFLGRENQENQVRGKENRRLGLVRGFGNCCDHRRPSRDAVSFLARSDQVQIEPLTPLTMARATKHHEN